MSDSNFAMNPDSQYIGPCSLALLNEVTDHLVMVGKVDDIFLEKVDPVNVFSTNVIGGQMVKTDGQPTVCDFQLRGKFKEVLDPNVLYLMMKNCGTPVQESNCTIKTAIEDYPAYPGYAIKLKHNAGFYTTDALPGPESVIGAAGGAGGSIVPDDYIFVVTCMYGTTESEYTESGEITIGAGEVVSVTITKPSGITPSSFRVYVYNDAETRADATLIATVDVQIDSDTVTIVFYELPRTGNLYPGDATSSFIVTDSEGTEYDILVDYTVDTTCAIVIPTTTGDIEEGEVITITYSYRANPYVEMSIGPSATLPPYVHPVLIALKNDDRAVTRPRGIEINLWKVLASSGWSWDLSSLNFDSGFEFTWDVLLSEKTLNHGKIEAFNRHLEAYDLSNWAALTEWANAPGCEDETS